MKISVIICTHNPRPAYFCRVLDALRQQTLPKDQWELLIVDNASTEPIASQLSLDWHTQARVVCERELGVVYARLRGISETVGDVIVIVDDDNVLAPDYLAEAVRIAERYSFLGAWGGRNRAEFEFPPPKWTEEFWPLLAIRDADTVRWSNTLDDWRAHPFGAGLCVRRFVAEHFVERLRTDATLRSLGRRGTSLVSGEDVDLVYTAREVESGFGTFPQLDLLHLIPANRTSKKYLLKLSEGIALSNIVLANRHGRTLEETVFWKTSLRFVLLLLLKGPRQAQFYLARKRGAAQGKKLLSASRNPETKVSRESQLTKTSSDSSAGLS